MGFYLRKSVRVGPLRFNLSRSGVGISAGVRGFRVGAGPRGNYVHMGRHGVYYRATLPSSASAQRQHRLAPETPVAPHHAVDSLTEIESADVSQIRDSSSEALLNELADKSRKPRLLPWVATATAVLAVSGVKDAWPEWLMILLVIAGSVALYMAHQQDLLRKTVVLLYNFDAEMEAVYDRFHNATRHMAASAQAWHIEAEGAVKDSKYHAGASSLVRRKATRIRPAPPPFVKTNVETVAMGVGRQTLYFFPDRVLVFDRGRVGAISYSNLMVRVGQSRFIEAGPVPRDATVIDRTWKYVNKKGGPDKRFKDNRELPVCLYEEVTLTSTNGLNEIIQLSRCGGGAAFHEAVTELARQLPPEVSPRSADSAA